MLIDSLKFSASTPKPEPLPEPEPKAEPEPEPNSEPEPTSEPQAEPGSTVERKGEPEPEPKAEPEPSPEPSSVPEPSPEAGSETTSRASENDNRNKRVAMHSLDGIDFKNFGDDVSVKTSVSFKVSSSKGKIAPIIPYFNCENDCNMQR